MLPVAAVFPEAAVERAVRGCRPVGWEQLPSRGYSRASGHWRARLDDGRVVFVKHALTADAVSWLRQEAIVYRSVSGSFMPELIGATDDEGATLIVLADLSGADWPPPWSDDRIEAVRAALGELHAVEPPAGVGSLVDRRDEIEGWGAVADDPRPFLATGLCSTEWLETALPVFAAASELAELAGNELLHFDVRSDNLCFVGKRVVLVDWNHACCGNGAFDIAFWLPSLRLEGGPEPWLVLPDAGPLAAVVAGFFASRAGLPPLAAAPGVRSFQRAQADVALGWVARELDLAPPRGT